MKISDFIPATIDDKDVAAHIEGLDDSAVSEMFIAHLDATDKYRKEVVRAGHKFSTTVAKKSVMMWGAIQETYSLGVGAKAYGCEGHGGIVTSRARQNAIDEELRRDNPFYLDGCGVYEEDCDANIYFAYFPKLAHNYYPGLGENVREEVVGSVLRWRRENVNSLLARLVLNERNGAMYAATAA